MTTARTAVASVASTCSNPTFPDSDECREEGREERVSEPEGHGARLTHNQGVEELALRPSDVSPRMAPFRRHSGAVLHGHPMRFADGASQMGTIRTPDQRSLNRMLNKVPEVTLYFWVIKISGSRSARRPPISWPTILGLVSR